MRDMQETHYTPFKHEIFADKPHSCGRSAVCARSHVLIALSEIRAALHELFCLSAAQSPHYFGPRPLASIERSLEEELSMDLTERLSLAAAITSFLFVGAVIIGLV
jgi:hypothetical protein